MTQKELNERKLALLRSIAANVEKLIALTEPKKP